MDVSPEVIYIIRHAEKPLRPSLSGVDYEGSPNEHSLLPRGWQRSGALVIWSFTRVPESGPAHYAFDQIPQQLLAGDAGTVI